MSLRERLQFASLNEYEVEVEKICRNDNNSAKEKHIQFLLNKFDGLPEDVTQTEFALIKRFKQKFTRKQYSHYLYFVLRTIGTPYNSKCLKVFKNYEHPFETKMQEIEEDELTPLNFIVSKYLDLNLEIEQLEYQPISSAYCIDVMALNSLVSKNCFVDSMDKMLTFLDESTSFNFDEGFLYDQRSPIDLIESLLKQVLITCFVCLQGIVLIYNTFSTVPENNIYLKFIKISEDFIKVYGKVQKVFSCDLVRQYFQYFPPINPIPLDVGYTYLKKKYDFELFEKGELNTPVEEVTFRDLCLVVSPANESINQNIEFIREHLALPTSRTSSGVSTPKKSFFSRNGSLSRNSSKSRGNSLSSSPQLTSPMKVTKKERLGLQQSSSISQNASFDY